MIHDINIEKKRIIQSFVEVLFVGRILRRGDGKCL
jgi:hypothetical protein